MPKIRILFFLLTVSLLFSCGTAEKPAAGRGEGAEVPAAADWPSPSFDTGSQDYRYYENIKYGPHEKQAINLWIPSADKPTPLVLYIHGGGFRGGDKALINSELLYLYLDAGMAYASVNYRLTADVTFPDTHLDCARAVQFLRHHAEGFNLDRSRFAATGGSAGAGISMWLAFKDDMAEPDSDDPISRQSTRLACIAVLDGQATYDPFFIREHGIPRLEEHAFFYPFYGIEKAELDTPKARKLYWEASAINYASEDDVPSLLNYSPWFKNVPVTDKTGLNFIVHHPKFGLVLKEKMDTLGVECIVQYFGHPEGKHITEFEFIFKHLAGR
jgi:acetyl esterase